MAVNASTGSAVDVARAAFEAIATRDPDAVVRHTAPDAVEERPDGDLIGHDALREFWKETFAAVPDLRVDVETIVGEGETAFVTWRLTGTFNGGPWNGIEPTGDRIELVGNDRMTVRDGLLVHNLVAYDVMSFARQIGMLPPEGSASERAMTAMFNARVKLRRRLRGLRGRSR